MDWSFTKMVRLSEYIYEEAEFIHNDDVIYRMTVIHADTGIHSFMYRDHPWTTEALVEAMRLGRESDHWDEDGILHLVDVIFSDEEDFKYDPYEY